MSASDPQVTYSRARERAGKVPLSTKIYQGIGALTDIYQNFAFKTFLLFFYNQVLGLNATWASFALMLALIVDAFTDPLVGSLSDNLKSRLGRRHPLMYGSAVPMGISICLLFLPPSGLSEPGLFAWLLGFAVATRVSQTFFEVPWNALFAEYSEDYDERSSIVTFRMLCGWIGGAAFIFLTWTFIFPETEHYPQGQLNPESYDTFAPVIGGLIAVVILLTTELTRRDVSYLLQPDQATPQFSLRRVIREVGMALANFDFRQLFLAILVFGALFGTGEALELYVNTYFWGLSGSDLRWFLLTALGAVAAFALVVPIQRRFDKKQILLACLLFLIVDKMLVVGLRLFFDILPPNGDPMLLVILVANAVVRAAAGATLLIIFTSMIADMLDVQELETGRRQEGVFASARSLSGKATSGVGVFVGGLLLEHALGFPSGVTTGVEVEQSEINSLAFLDGYVMPLIYLFPAALMMRYRITRPVHQRLRQALAEKRANGHTTIDIWRD